MYGLTADKPILPEYEDHYQKFVQPTVGVMYFLGNIFGILKITCSKPGITYHHTAAPSKATLQQYGITSPQAHRSTIQGELNKGGAGFLP